jgi:hypothetical protein
MARPPERLFTSSSNPTMGLSADSEEKHEPVRDIDTIVEVDGLKGGITANFAKPRD